MLAQLGWLLEFDVISIPTGFGLDGHDGGTLIRPISARYMRRKETSTTKEKLPKLQSDEEAEEFVANAREVTGRPGQTGDQAICDRVGVGE